jgi:predicted kinase
MDKQPMLIVFGGLPGAGKTTLARALSAHLDGVYLRIDTIEQALLPAGGMKIGHEGYLVAYAVAEDNLRMGNTVIADSVNPIDLTRAAWQDVANRNNAKIVEIEVTCSDKQEHRSRVESRKPDIPGHRMPTWQEVATREYHVWKSRNIAIDTAGRSEDECMRVLMQRVGAFV